jgi:hypothetical protein
VVAVGDRMRGLMAARPFSRLREKMSPKATDEGGCFFSSLLFSSLLFSSLL